MKTTLRFRGLNSQSSWRRLVVQQLKSLQSLAELTAAEVVLHLQPGDQPLFRVQVLLAISDLNLQAEATERTRQAALLKATQDLARQIRVRDLNFMEQGKNGFQLSASSSRWLHN